MTTGEAAPRRAAEVADVLAKCGAIAVAVLYVLGAIVTTIRYARYGVTSWNLFRAQYVVAGSWAVLPIAAVAAFVIVWQVKSEKWFFRTITGIPLFAIFVFSMLDSLEVFGYSALELVFAVFIVTGVCLTLDVLPSVQRMLVTGDEPLDGGEKFALTIVVIVFPLALYLGVFATELYPEIPAWVGGGAPISVRLVAKPGASIPPEAIGDRNLLYETDTVYVIEGTSEDIAVITVPRDAVASVSFLNPSRTPSPSAPAVRPAR